MYTLNRKAYFCEFIFAWLLHFQVDSCIKLKSNVEILIRINFTKDMLFSAENGILLPTGISLVMYLYVIRKIVGITVPFKSRWWRRLPWPDNRLVIFSSRHLIIVSCKVSAHQLYTIFISLVIFMETGFIFCHLMLSTRCQVTDIISVMEYLICYCAEQIQFWLFYTMVTYRSYKTENDTIWWTTKPADEQILTKRKPKSL